MPGLIEFHSHLQKDFGEAQGRAWLAFGVTTVRSPGNTPYEAVEDKEANEAGVRIGPRVYGTGYLMEWQRVYYKMGVAISSVAHLEMELQRAKVLQHDLIKSYVRLPDLQQKRMVEFAHSIGVPVATHEIFPAALVGVDNTEHTAATSRRGYSPKQSPNQRAYEDVVQLFGQSERYWCPMMSGGGVRRLFEAAPALRQDPRFALYPQWMQNQVRNPGQGGNPGGGADSPGNDQMLMEIFKAGGKVVAGTDTPNAFNLHGELNAYVKAGMTPYQALRAATVTPAEALNLDAGQLTVGKLADIVLVEGNPLVEHRRCAEREARHRQRAQLHARRAAERQEANWPAAHRRLRRDWRLQHGRSGAARLVDDRWRVTDAPQDCVDDGRDYPAAQA